MNRANYGDRRRTRILSDLEIKAMWHACERAGSFGAFLRVALLTGQRKSKVAGMRRSDVDDGGVWRISSERREKNNAGQLALPQLALETLRAQEQVAGNPHFFPATSGAGPLNSFGAQKRSVDDEIRNSIPDLPHWTIHDLRRTARSLMSRAGVMPHVAERVLGHAIVGVEAVYDRHDYAEQKTVALQVLANLVQEIVAGPSLETR